MRGQDLLMRLSPGLEEVMSQAPNQKWRKTARCRETQNPDLSPPGLPTVGCVTLTESLNLSQLFPDKEEQESLLKWMIQPKQRA